MKLRSGVHMREFGSELVLLDLENGQYYGLDAVGLAMVRALLAGEDPEQFAVNLATQYAVETERVVADMSVLRAELVQRRLLLDEP